MLTKAAKIDEFPKRYPAIYLDRLLLEGMYEFHMSLDGLLEKMGKSFVF